MDYEQAVIEFLSHPENFRLAMEVTEHIDEVKRRIEIAFWHRCHDHLCDRLAGSEWAGSWAVEIDPDKELARDGCGVRLLPRDAGDRNAVVLYYLTREYYGSFYYYLRLPRPEKVELTDEQAPILEELQALLKEQSYKPTKWSFGWKAIRKYDGPNPFLLELAERSEELAVEAADFIWDTFGNTAAVVERLNAALRSEK